jgi:hypothetical protein
VFYEDEQYFEVYLISQTDPHFQSRLDLILLSKVSNNDNSEIIIVFGWQPTLVESSSIPDLDNTHLNSPKSNRFQS